VTSFPASAAIYEKIVCNVIEASLCDISHKRFTRDGQAQYTAFDMEWVYLLSET
jgi:hypothetical protein